MTGQTTPPTGAIGIVGAGKSGTAIARLAVAAGYQVQIASSGSPADTEMMMRVVAPGVQVVPIDDVARGTDLVVIAVPLRRFRELPRDLFAGRTVVDVMNYWPPIDGVLPEFENTDQPSSVIIQRALPATSSLVKTFNHLGYHQMEYLAAPAGTAGRVALGVAGDDRAAKEAVMRFVNTVGFDAADAGTLEDSRPLQPETAIFGAALDSDTLSALLARHARTV